MAFSAETQATVQSLLADVDVFLPNEAEACALAGMPGGDARAAARILQRDSGGWVVVMIAGARGVRGVHAALT